MFNGQQVVIVIYKFKEVNNIQLSNLILIYFIQTQKTFFFF